MKKTILLASAFLLAPLAHASQPGFHQSVVADLERKATVFQALRDCKPTGLKINSRQYLVYPYSDDSCNYEIDTPLFSMQCTLDSRTRHQLAIGRLSAIYEQLNNAYTHNQIQSPVIKDIVRQIEQNENHCIKHNK